MIKAPTFMGVKAVMASVILVALAGGAQAQAAGATQVDTLRTLLRQNGCVLDIASAQTQLAAVGLRMDQAYKIVGSMVADGRASLGADGATVSLDSAQCQGQASVEPAKPSAGVVDRAAARDGVLAMLAGNGCEITQSNAADMIAAAGLDYTTSMQILTKMMGSGEATSRDGGQTLNVGAPLCAAAGAVSMTPRVAFINLIKRNNCRMTVAEFSAALPVEGLDAATAFGVIGELEAEGAIHLPASRDVVTLSAEMCR